MKFSTTDCEGKIPGRYFPEYYAMQSPVAASRARLELLSLISNTLCALLVLVSASCIMGQSLPLEKVNSGRGLSQGMVHDLIQDHKGFLWICTKEGLNRFDGYDFRVYRHNPFDSLSLPDNRTTSIVEDKSHRLWIHTAKGLCLFDPAREIFMEVHLSADQTRTLSPDEFTGLFVDTWGSIWMTSASVICRLSLPDGSYDLSALQIQQVSLGSATPGTESLFELKKGIAQLSDTIFLVGVRKRPKLLLLDPRSQQLTLSEDLSFFPESTREAFDTETGVRKFFPGRDGKLWLLSANTISQINPYAEPTIVQDIQTLYPLWDVWYSWDLLEDPQGTLVITTSRGLIVCDPGERFKVYSQEDIAYLLYYFGRMIFDEAGILWIGTRGFGLLKSNLRATRFSESRVPGDEVIALSAPSVRTVLETTSGKILFGSGDYLYSVDLDTKMARPVLSAYLSVQDLYEDRLGNVWLAGRQLLRLVEDPVDGWTTSAVYDIPNSSAYNGVSLLESADSILWVLTIQNLCSFDRSNGTFACMDLPASGVRSSAIPEFPCLIEGELGILWLGTHAGLIKFNPAARTFDVYQNDPSDPESLVSNVVRSILPDPHEPQRYLWIGTAGGGLSKFDIASGRCRHFGEEDGLPDISIYGVLADAQKNLWMSTNHGLVVMDPKTETFKTYNSDDGLLDDEFNANAYSKSHDGVMLFGNIRGFNRFQPDSMININKHLPEIAFTGFKLNNEEVEIGNSVFPYTTSITYSEQISIPARFKSFSIEYAALDFSAPERNQYMYQMDGFDEDWQYAGHARSAAYTNLDPGEYTFRVKASNNDGVWNDAGIWIKIRILPPWYRTIWAYALYAILLGALLYFLRRKELREQRLKHQLVLEHVEAEKQKEVNSMKSRFFANISHELRTPLTLVLGYLEKARDQVRDRSVRKGLDIATRNGRRLLQMVNQLLDLSKIDAGQTQLNRVQQDVIPILKSTLFAFESLAAQRVIELTFDCAAASVEFAFDRDKLERVFVNLISNAVRFTPDGGEVRLAVSVTSSGSGVDTMIASVSDTGPGVPEEALPRVFDRFYQAASPAAAVTSGTGIGLALVKELVQLHGGEVSAANARDRGAVFTVTLPMVQGEASGAQRGTLPDSSDSLAKETAWIDQVDMEITAVEPVVASTTPSSDGAWQVLVVEDNADVRTFIRDLLLQEGYHVAMASDGQAGLQAALELIPDLIISDVMMPVMDGITMSGKVRSDVRISHIPIIMLTARAGEENKIEGLETGVDDYLTKPVSSRELLARIANLITQRTHLKEKFASIEISRPEEITAVPMDQAFLEQAFTLVRDNLGDPTFGVELLADRMHMSVKNLTRKLNALVGRSPGQIIRETRLQRAADLLTRQAATVTDVAYDVGYTAPENFSRSFKKHFGVTPTEYANGARAVKE